MAQTIFLADTHVVSKLVEKTPNASVMKWLQSVKLLSISTVTIEEVHFGLAWQPNARKLSLFNAVVRSLHAVYPVTESIAQRDGMLRGQFQAQGITHSTPDTLLAATRNVRDFTGCGVQVVNPFERVEQVNRCRSPAR